MGVEISKEMTDYAQRNLGLKVINGDFQEIDFNGNMFDIIYSAHTLEHVTDPLQFLSKVKSIIKRDGILKKLKSAARRLIPRRNFLIYQ